MPAGEVLEGHGAVSFAMMEWEHAVRRGVKTYAEIAGVGFASEAHHLTAPDPSGQGAALAMQRALSDGAGMRTQHLMKRASLRDLDYVPNEARPMTVDLALANSFAFGGHCVSLAVQRPSPN